MKTSSNPSFWEASTRESLCVPLHLTMSRSDKLIDVVDPFPQRVDLPRAKFDQMMSGTLLREHAAKEIKFFDATERVFLHPVRFSSSFPTRLETDNRLALGFRPLWGDQDQLRFPLLLGKEPDDQGFPSGRDRGPSVRTAAVRRKSHRRSSSAPSLS